MMNLFLLSVERFNSGLPTNLGFALFHCASQA